MALEKARLIRCYLEFLWLLGIPFPLKNNRVRGWYGEWVARKYLQEKKFYILEKNWQSGIDGRREIDLITKDRECLVFVEVRARASGSLNTGYHSINRRKKKVILSACRDYLRLKSQKFPHYRFDVIEVDLGKTTENIHHHENVSLFP